MMPIGVSARILGLTPSPGAPHLQEKLDFLERNRLNLYDDSQCE